MLFWNSLIMTPVIIKVGEQERKEWERDWSGEPHRNVFCLFTFFLGHDPFSVYSKGHCFLLYLPLPLVLSHLAS